MMNQCQLVTKNSTILLLFIISIIIVGCTSTQELLNDDFPDISLEVLNSNESSNAKILSEDNSFNLIVVVKENDCHSCLGEIDEYNRLFDEIHSDNLKVTMIYQGSRETGKKLISDYKIKFRVLLDENNKFKHDEFFSTPIKFLVQKLGNRKTIVFINFKNNNPDRQKSFSAVIKEIVYGLFY